MAIPKPQRFLHKVEKVESLDQTIPTTQAKAMRPAKRGSQQQSDEIRHLTRAVKTSTRQQAQLIATVERFIGDQSNQDATPHNTGPKLRALPNQQALQAELSPVSLSTIDKMAAAVRSGHLLQKDQTNILRDVHHDMRETLTALQKFSADLTQAHRQQVETSTALLAQSREALKSQQFQITELRRQQEQACFLLEQHHEARLRRNDRHHRIQTRLLIAGSLAMAALLVACVLMLMHTASRIGSVAENSPTNSASTESATELSKEPIASTKGESTESQFPNANQE